MTYASTGAERPPNPGSAEAIENGCLCPTEDNVRGNGFPCPGVKGPVFWVNGDCPLHGE